MLPDMQEARISRKVHNDGLSSWCIPAFFFFGKIFNSSLDVVSFCRMSFIAFAYSGHSILVAGSSVCHKQCNSGANKPNDSV